MNNNQHFTLCIIGGGPIGLACAIEAQKAGIDYVILEKGCLVNSIFNYPINMSFFSTSERLELDNIPFVSIQNKPRRPEALEYYRRIVESRKLNLHLFEEVLDVERQHDGFTLKTTKQSLTAQFVIIATGFYDLPYMLNVPGEDLPKVHHYYNDPHLYAFRKVIVVGAMNSAVDAALETWRKGAEVTMIIRGSEIGSRVKYWVRPDIENRIQEGSIKAYFNSTIASIQPLHVTINTPDGLIKLDNDVVIAMTGYQPNIAFLEKCGISLDPTNEYKPTYNEDTHESNIQGLYLAGVVCGGLNTHSYFIENSRIHAQIIINDIIKQK